MTQAKPVSVVDIPAVSLDVERGSTNPVARAVSAAVKELRSKRGWSAQTLSDETERQGHRIPRTVIANAESDRRDMITVDELVAFARAFNILPADLLFGETSLCMVCHGTPPLGFICATCGLQVTEATPELISLTRVIAAAKLDGARTVQDLAQSILDAGYQQLESAR